MARESTLTNMVVTLFAVCLVSAALLGGLYALTAEPIAAAQTAKINTAIGGVVPAFTNAPSAEKFTVEASSSAGFGGTITLMVGFLPDGTIHGTSVISHAETPGLGAKISEGQSHFVTQFQGKNPGDPNFKFAVKKDGGSFDAITASTITSRAYIDVLNNAYNAFLNINKSEEAQQN